VSIDLVFHVNPLSLTNATVSEKGAQIDHADMGFYAPKGIFTGLQDFQD
jgi:hypothetical protein